MCGQTKVGSILFSETINWGPATNPVITIHLCQNCILKNTVFMTQTLNSFQADAKTHTYISRLNLYI